MTDQPTMTIDAVIEEFGRSVRTVPRESMQWALDNWAVAAPRFLELLSRYVDGTDRSEQTQSALLIIIHLLSEKAETGAFQNLCRLLHDHEGMETILGDAITPKLSRLLISLFDGDVATLRSVVESADVDEFVRHAAINAAAYLTRIGRIPEAETHAWLRNLLTAMQAPKLNDVWHGWVECVAMLGLEDLVPDVQSLFEREFIDTSWLEYSNVEADLKLTLDDPDRMAGFAAKHLAPITSAIDELTKLNRVYEFSVPDEDRDVGQPPAPPRQVWTSGPPQVWSSGGSERNPWRHVGRNDPCPCGSGKKFKKCCLGKPDAELPIVGAARGA
jgi:hypothetical protein